MTKQSRLLLAISLISGVFLLALGFCWTLLADPRANWSANQAEEYAEASAAMHEAAHGHEGNLTNDQFIAVRKRYDKIKAQLDETRGQPDRTAFWLKSCGGVLAILGVTAWYLLGNNTIR